MRIGSVPAFFSPIFLNRALIEMCFYDSYPVFWEHSDLENPLQHQTSTTLLWLLRENPSTLPLSCSRCCVSTSTPKPRAEGSSPSAPANPLVPRPCENRMVWGFFVPMRPWTRSTKFRLMLHPLLSSHIWPQLVFTTVFPSSTQNAPGFAFFWLNRVRFSLFRCFQAAKFSPWFLCNLPHSAHKLKPSVMPCRRDVSFLT